MQPLSPTTLVLKDFAEGRSQVVASYLTSQRVKTRSTRSGTVCGSMQRDRWV